MAFIKIGILILLCLASVLGRNIVDELEQRFNDETNECFDSKNVTQPSYKCSGLILRGVRSNNHEIKFAWGIKPADKEKKSFSFGYLRRDHPFSWLGKGYEAGFIIYPHLRTPRHKSTQKVLCYFPVDGHTDVRLDRGCGQRDNDTIGISRPCHLQNITTFPRWVEHFKEITDETILFIMSQCGFDMTKKTELDNFSVALQANIYLQNGTTLASIASELRVESWDENNTKTLPIEAFFYFSDTKNGKKEAIKYRNDFFIRSGGEKIPIVEIQLPTKTNPEIHITELKDSFKFHKNFDRKFLFNKT